MKKPETLQEKILFGRLVYFPLCEDYIKGITLSKYPYGKIPPEEEFNKALSEDPPVQSEEDQKK